MHLGIVELWSLQVVLCVFPHLTQVYVLLYHLVSAFLSGPRAFFLFSSVRKKSYVMEVCVCASSSLPGHSRFVTDINCNDFKNDSKNYNYDNY